MSNAYKKAIEEYAPDEVDVVHDRFHLVSAMNDTIDAIRRGEQRRLEDEDKKVIKGTRYLLLYSKDRLEEQSPERLARLEEVLEANETLHKAHLLKEKFRRFWEQRSKWDAEIFLPDWILEAAQVGNQHLTRIAKRLMRHFDQIVAWYDHEISTGPLEGIYNKIKVLQRNCIELRIWYLKHAEVSTPKAVDAVVFQDHAVVKRADRKGISHWRRTPPIFAWAEVGHIF